jgi:hypothetical protein
VYIEPRTATLLQPVNAPSKPQTMARGNWPTLMVIDFDIGQWHFEDTFTCWLLCSDHFSPTVSRGQRIRLCRLIHHGMNSSYWPYRFILLHHYTGPGILLLAIVLSKWLRRPVCPVSEPWPVIRHVHGRGGEETGSGNGKGLAQKKKKKDRERRV